jgi:hypothetical protein
MKEARTKEIEILEVTAAQMNFTLRLAYTGRVDPADWAGMASEQEASSPEFGKALSSLPCFSPFPKGAGKGEPIQRSSPYPSPFLSEASSSSSRDATIKQIPLELLFGCASLAKKYEIPGFISMMLAKIKPRLKVDNFDKIMQFAVTADLSPLKLFCIKFAEGETAIKTMFESKQLSPEVEFELQALWKAPSDNALLHGQKAEFY